MGSSAGNMKSVLKQENLTELVKSTVKRICKVSLDYEDEIEIQGTLGITIDKKKMFLICINELIDAEEPNANLDDDVENMSGQSNKTLNNGHTDQSAAETTSEGGESLPVEAVVQKPKSKRNSRKEKRASAPLSSCKSKRRKGNNENRASRSFIDAFLNNDETTSASEEPQIEEPLLDIVPASEIKVEETAVDLPCNDDANSDVFIYSPQNTPSKALQPIVVLDDCKSPVKNNISINEIRPQEEDVEQMNKETNGKDGNIQIVLPDFSSVVKKKLRGNRSELVWHKMIHEASEYYFTKRPEMMVSKGQVELFQTVAERLFHVYPAIGRPEHGENEWTKFGNDLWCRVEQLQSETHSNGHKNGKPRDDSGSCSKKKTSVKRRSSKSLPLPGSKSEDVKSMVQLYDELLQPGIKENEKSLRIKIKEYVGKTFNKRRKWIEDMDESGSVQAILDVFPVFKDPEFVSAEMYLMKGNETMAEVNRRCDELFEQVHLLMPDVASHRNTDVDIFKFMETETALVQRGTHSGTRSIVELHEDASDEFIANTKRDTDPQHSPILLLFTNNNEIKEAVILTDGEQINACKTSFRKCILSLLFVYYIAWIDYPREYSQILGLFQHTVLGEVFTEKKTNLTNFLKRLEKLGKTV